MRNKLYTVFMCMFILCFAPLSAQDTFRNIEFSLMNGNFLTQDEIDNKTTVSFGVAIDESGNATRVDKDDASANIVLQNFKYHNNEHGFSPGTFIVPVSGNVKISIGGCAYGGDVTVKDASGDLVTTFSNTVGCYHNSPNPVAVGYYSGEATTLSISGGSYIPYIAIEAVNETPSTGTVSFGLGSYTDIGTAPASETIQLGEEYTLPMNRTLYVEGQTLTAWTDGTDNYTPGQTITVTGDLALSPVFSANSVSLADRDGDVAVTWDFQRKYGAPTLALEGKSGIYISQATVNGNVIDVKIDLNATKGKINNKIGRAHV